MKINIPDYCSGHTAAGHMIDTPLPFSVAFWINKHHLSGCDLDTDAAPKPFIFDISCSLLQLRYIHHYGSIYSQYWNCIIKPKLGPRASTLLENMILNNRLPRFSFGNSAFYSTHIAYMFPGSVLPADY